MTCPNFTITKFQEEKIELKDGKEGYGVEAGYSTDYGNQATTALDGGAEETTYDNSYANGASNSGPPAGQATNPFTQQQYRQVPASTNPFAKK